jgi:deoxycytidine triphosphate deaminase
MLSDRDIESFLNKEIVIHPYTERNLTPVGYNLNPGNFVYSINSKSLIKITHNSKGKPIYKILKHDTVLILTQEAVWVSKKIGGTFHSKVGVVSLGFGHISTTLDPGWAGPLLIALNNPTEQDLELPADKSFVTLIFYKVRTVASRNHDNDPSRSDLLKIISEETLGRINTSSQNKFLTFISNNKLEQKEKELLIKAEEIISNPLAYDEFKKAYEQLSQDSSSFIINGFKRSFMQTAWQFSFNIFLNGLEAILIFIILLKIISTVPNLRYQEPLHTFIKAIDMNGFLAILALLISCFQLSESLKEK